MRKNNFTYKKTNRIWINIIPLEHLQFVLAGCNPPYFQHLHITLMKLRKTHQFLNGLPDHLAKPYFSDNTRQWLVITPLLI